MPSLDEKDTELLFWTDSYQTVFTAKVIEVRKDGVILDKTLFYPEGGGQLSDSGILSLTRDLSSTFRVTSVQKIDNGLIHKLSDAEKAKVRDKLKSIWDGWIKKKSKRIPAKKILDATLAAAKATQ